MQSFNKLLLLCAGTALVFTACGDSGTDNNNTSTSPSPKIGSTFTFSVKTLDTVGNVVSGRDSIRIDSTIAIDQSKLGKTAVSRFVRRSSPVGGSGTRTDTLDMNYESNGNVSYLMQDTTGGKNAFGFAIFRIVWLPLPVKTQSPVLLPGYDTSYTSSGNARRDVMNQSVGYVGKETMIIGTDSLACERSDYTFQLQQTTNGITVTGTIGTSVWYCPALGYIVKFRQVQTGFVAGTGGTEWMMTGYVKK